MVNVIKNAMRAASTVLAALSLIPTVAVGEIVGSLSASYQVNSGRLSTTVALPVADYRGGIGPTLSLQLEEAMQNRHMGLGATLGGLSEIYACAANDRIDGATLAYDVASSRFCADGRRLVLESGSLGVVGSEYKFARDDGSVFELQQNGANTVWVAYMSDGRVVRYGGSANSTVPNIRWKLSTVSDAFGNSVEYRYLAGNDQAIDEIEYGTHRIAFNYETRQDVRSGYYFGSLLTMDQRLASITEYNNELARGEYRFGYDEVGANRYSRIRTVTWCVGTSDNCYAPIEFDYDTVPDGAPTPEGALTWSSNKVIPLPQNTPGSGSKASAVIYAVGDINQDGYSDICYTNSEVWCALNSSSGYSPPTKWSDAAGVMADYSINDEPQNPSALTFQLLNLNDDQYPDFCFLHKEATYCGLNQQGNGFGAVTRWSTWHAKDRTFFADIDRDGLMDQCLSTGPTLKYKSVENSEESHFVGVDHGASSAERPQAALSCRRSSGTGFGVTETLLNHSFAVKSELEVVGVPITSLAGGTTYTSGVHHHETTGSIPNPTVNLVDINADGVTDYCGADSTGYGCYLGRSSVKGQLPAFDSSLTYWDDGQASQWNSRWVNLSWRMADLNVDGIVDACYAETDQQYDCMLNSGEGFESPSQWLAFDPVLSKNGHSYPWEKEEIADIKFLDVTQDGSLDLCAIMNYDQLMCATNLSSSGSSGFAAAEYQATVYGMGSLYEARQSSSKRVLLWKYSSHHYGQSLVVSAGPMRLVGDLDGDGLSQLCYRGATGIYCNNVYAAVSSRLMGMSDGYGNRSTFEYGSYQRNGQLLSETADAGLLTLNRDVYGVLHSTDTDVEGRSARATYYVGGFGYSRDEGGKGYRVQQTVYNDGSKARSETIQIGIGEGLARKNISYTNEIKLREERFSYTELANPLNANITQTILGESVTEKWATDGVKLSTSTSTVDEYDSYGNVKKLTQLTEAGPEQLSVSTVTNYFPPSHFTKKYINNKPQNITVTHSLNGEVVPARKTSHEYYSDSSALWSTTLQEGSDLESTVTYAYDDFGNKTSQSVTGVADEDGTLATRTNSYTFDSAGVHLESTTNALGHTTTYSDFDALCGAPEKITDANGLVVTITLNDQCQKISETLPNGEVVSYQEQKVSPVAAAMSILSVGGVKHQAVRMTRVSSNRRAKVETYFDSLGREVRVDIEDACTDGQTACANGRRTIRQDQYYNGLGQLVAQSQPYFATAVGAAVGQPHSTYQYDEFGRIVVERENDTDAAREKHTAYGTSASRGTVTVTLPGGATKQTTSNVHGQVSEVYENGTLAVKNTYDALGQLKTATSHGYTIVNQYDDKGNRTETNDPDMGVWSYKFNAFGELVWQKDANGAETRKRYDALGRTKKVIAPDMTSTYTYDEGTGAVKGKLTKVTNGSTTKEWGFDGYGRTTSETVTIKSKTFVTSFTYDGQGRLKETTYPEYEGNVDSPVLKKLVTTHEYDALGRLKRISMPREREWEGDEKILEEMAKRITASIAEQEKVIEDARKIRNASQVAVDNLRSAGIKLLNDKSIKNGKLDQLDAALARANADYTKYSNIISDLSAKKYAVVSWARDLTAKLIDRSKYLYRVTNSYTCGSGKNKKTCVETFDFSLSADILSKAYGSSAARSTVVASEVYSKAIAYYQNLVNKARETFDSGDEQKICTGSIKTRTCVTRGQIEEELRSIHMQIAINESSLESAENTLRLDVEQLNRIERASKINELEGIQESINQQITQLGKKSGLLTIWEETAHDAAGRLTGAYMGVGMTSFWDYDPNTAQLDKIQVKNSAGQLLQNTVYGYDFANNVDSRADSVTGENSSFTYDSLDRIDTASIRANGVSLHSYDYNYDSRGNITYKSDVGTYQYANSTNNRLSGIRWSNGRVESYSYDNNGNILRGRNGQTYSWSSYNKPRVLTAPGERTEVEYDAGYQRAYTKQSKPGETTRTWHVGAHFEYEEHQKAGATTKRLRHNVYANGQVVMVMNRSTITDPSSFESNQLGRTVEVKQTDEMRWMLYDALGSVVATANRVGVIQSRHIYDPFGRRIDLPGYQARTVKNDYATHEELGQGSLIFAKARIYDPVIGRFLSADIFIPAPDNSQAYNRYAYVMNNPLKYNDPTGHFPMFLVGALITIFSMHSDNPVVRVVGSIIGSLMMGIGPGMDPMSSAGLARIAGAGFVNGYGATGNVADGAQGATIAVVSAGFANGIGGLNPDSNGFLGTLPGKALLHGVVGGGMSLARGREFRTGFASSVVAKLSPATSWANPRNPQYDVATRAAVAMMFGGLASEAAGGSLVEGAMQAMVMHLYNNEGGWRWAIGGIARWDRYFRNQSPSDKVYSLVISKLDSQFEKQLFTRYWTGSGNRLEITNLDLVKRIEAAGVWEGKGRLYSFYESSEFDKALGRATLEYGELGQLIGIYDFYDFDPKFWGEREFIAELQTRGVNYSANIFANGVPFEICYGSLCN